ncbi:hypothetical protein D3C80_1129310 [compost metagenome]
MVRIAAGILVGKLNRQYFPLPDVETRENCFVAFPRVIYCDHYRFLDYTLCELRRNHDHSRRAGFQYGLYLRSLFMGKYQ